ncbi:hypothetical protein HF283_00675 [Acidithiobacillus ferrooxidans]|nr:hypothetical protein [Acidithiobacillus ferrooxidans]
MGIDAGAKIASRYLSYYLAGVAQLHTDGAVYHGRDEKHQHNSAYSRKN